MQISFRLVLPSFSHPSRPLASLSSRAGASLSLRLGAKGEKRKAINFQPEEEKRGKGWNDFSAGGVHRRLFSSPSLLY